MKMEQSLFSGGSGASRLALRCPSLLPAWAWALPGERWGEVLGPLTCGGNLLEWPHLPLCGVLGLLLWALPEQR